MLSIAHPPGILILLRPMHAVIRWLLRPQRMLALPCQMLLTWCVLYGSMLFPWSIQAATSLPPDAPLPLAVAAVGPTITISPAELVFSGVKDQTSPVQQLTIRNDGTESLQISSISLVGTNPGDFDLVNPPALPISVPVGQNLMLGLVFDPDGTVGALRAAVRIASNATNQGTLDVGVYGLSANGSGGTNEPPFQAVVNTLGYAVDVGGTGLILGTGSAPIGDEVRRPLFRRATTGPVTIKAVARYSPDESLPFGYYTLDDLNPVLEQLGSIAKGQYQTLNPSLATGSRTSFDPGDAPFGIYVNSLSFDRKSYTQDGLNTGTPHATRIYPLKNRAGQLVANSYLVAFEDASNGDYQDYVFVISNAAPLVTGSAGSDARSPTVNVQLSGEKLADGRYKNQAIVTISADDGTGSGVAAIGYRLYTVASTPFQPYSAPLNVTTQGIYTVIARAMDAVGNITTSSKQTFEIAESSTPVPTSTNTATSTPTETVTLTPTETATSRATETSMPTEAATSTLTATTPDGPVATNTATATSTTPGGVGTSSTPTSSPSSTPTASATAGTTNKPGYSLFLPIVQH